MAINPPNVWDGPANDLKQSKELVSRIRGRLEWLLRSNGNDSTGIVYDQIVRLERLKSDLSETRSEINDIGEDQKKRTIQLIKDYEDKLEAHENKLKRRNSEIKALQRQLSDLKSGRTPAPPPPRPRDPPPRPSPPPSSPRRVIPTSIRRDWLRRLELLNESSSYQIAIINSDVGEVRHLLNRRRQVPESALHVAALFGEVEIADLLLKDRSSSINVNQTTKVARLSSNLGDNQFHSYGVTPMHVAVGAQQHEMIRFLCSQGGSLHKPSNIDKNKPVGPPRYLLLEGWLDMIGCRDPMEVIRTVDLWTSLPRPWYINSYLDAKQKTILDFAMELEIAAPSFRSTLVRELQNRGATR